MSAEKLAEALRKVRPMGYRFDAPGITKISQDPHGGKWVRLYSEEQVIHALAAHEAEQEQAGEAVAWLYTLEYGGSIADRKVSLDRLRYPFGVCGADYLRVNDDGMSYVRETPLRAHGITKDTKTND